MKQNLCVRQSLALLLASVLLWGSVIPGRAAEEADPTAPEASGTAEPTVIHTQPSTAYTEGTTETTQSATESTAENTEPTEATTAPTAVTAESTEAPTVSATEPTEAPTASTTEPTETATVPATEATTAPTEETEVPAEMTEAPAQEETIPTEAAMQAMMLLAEEAPGPQRFGSQDTPMEATAGNSVASLGSSSGIRFRIFNYANGKDASGNNITAGGINDNGLNGYFNFRGTSYENTGADGTAVSNVTNSITDIDGYTANHATVLPVLSGGYPVFDASRDNGPNRSLGYLFGAGGNGVTAYTAGNTLLRMNEKGQYFYNSASNAVDYDTRTNRFIVRTYQERGQTTAGQGTGQYYDFFPFTYWDGTTKAVTESGKWYNYNNTVEVDYWYGMTMEATFSMPEDGKVNGQDDMIFEFSGDDDVWVFIDDVLVLDLGGTHGVVSGSINFATGEVKQYLDWNGANASSARTSYPTTLEARFSAAERLPNGGWSPSAASHGSVFANYSEHTIKFFYLERATSCANCKILFNMPILPTGTLTVEKQITGTETVLTKQADYGFVLLQQTAAGERAAAGIRFDRINVSDGTVISTGTTGADGSFTLEAGQRAEFDLTAGKTFLVRETDPGAWAEPAGCSVNGEVQPLPDVTGEIVIDPHSPSAAVFANRLKTTFVSIRKQVAGNMGDRDQAFFFTARLYTGDPGTGGSFLSFPAPGPGEAYTLEEGEARFSLTHGQTPLVLDDIPVGAYLVLTETPAEGYDTVCRIGETIAGGRTVAVDTLTEPVELTFTNTREVLIDTGISLDGAPYLWMTASAAALPMLRRRRKDE